MPPTPKKAPPADPVDELEDAAYADFVAAVDSGDDAGGKAALRDFVRACVQREMGGAYGPAEEAAEGEG